MAKGKQMLYTQQGYQELVDELHYLKHEKREKIKNDIAVARSFGDLSENSEYDAAKEEQGKIHARIAELREMINNAKVLDESQIDETKISVGSIVVVFNKERNMEKKYHIVGSYETDPKNGKISDDSPIGRAIIGAREGEEVLVVGPIEQHLVIKSVTRAKEQ